MSTIKNPQEKKRLSYKKDCRNCFGENDKSSRKSISKRKKLRSRSIRSASIWLRKMTNQPLDEDLYMETEARVKSSEKLKKVKGFKKEPDEQLKQHIEKGLYWRERRYGRRKNS